MIANRISCNWKLFICLDIFAINLIASASIYNIYLFTSFPIVIYGGSGGNRTHSSSKAPVLQTGLPTLTVYWPIFGAGEGIRTLTSQAQRILSPWRLPVPPLPHIVHFYAELRFSFSSLVNRWGVQDSNLRHRAP